MSGIARGSVSPWPATSAVQWLLLLLQLNREDDDDDAAQKKD